MIGYIANTDQSWFEFLGAQPPQPEVNFWFPSDYRIFRGPIGSPWLFRLKAPLNAIGGFGIVSWSDRLPEYLAWECFGQGNGAPTFEEFQARIERLRDRSDIQMDRLRDQIGCTVLSEPIFFPPERWVPQPTTWKKANLRYEGYDLTAGEGLRVWRACKANAASLAAPVTQVLEPAEAAERVGAPTLIQPRLGQGVFRLAVTDAYGRACAITNEHSLPALEAAHIKPYGRGGDHAIPNGLLLRSDLHRLFDRGYVTVTPDHRLEVSRLLKEDFSNGRSYYPLHGSIISLPTKRQHFPDGSLLRWHNDNVFRS